MLLVVELQFDLVSDLVDEDLSQQDAHQLQERKRKRDARQCHPAVLRAGYTAPGKDVPDVCTTHPTPQILPRVPQSCN